MKEYSDVKKTIFSYKFLKSNKLQFIRDLAKHAFEDLDLSGYEDNIDIERTFRMGNLGSTSIDGKNIDINPLLFFNFFNLADDIGTVFHETFHASVVAKGESEKYKGDFYDCYNFDNLIEELYYYTTPSQSISRKEIKSYFYSKYFLAPEEVAARNYSIDFLSRIIESFSEQERKSLYGKMLISKHIKNVNEEKENMAFHTAVVDLYDESIVKANSLLQKDFSSLISEGLFTKCDLNNSSKDGLVLLESLVFKLDRDMANEVFTQAIKLPKEINDSNENEKITIESSTGKELSFDKKSLLIENEKSAIVITSGLMTMAGYKPTFVQYEGFVNLINDYSNRYFESEQNKAPIVDIKEDPYSPIVDLSEKEISDINEIFDTIYDELEK